MLPQLKYEYQEQTAEVEVIGADGGHVITNCSNFLRFLVKEAKDSNTRKIELNFENYSKQILKLFFDMISCVNNIELGINDILQLLELTLGNIGISEMNIPGIRKQ